MTKRYRERIEGVQVTAPAGTPVTFRWRGQEYRVVTVLGHWHEEPGWWRRRDGVPQRLERTDLWRVEARNGVPTRGVYELVQRGEEWRLDRVWD